MFIWRCLWRRGHQETPNSSYHRHRLWASAEAKIRQHHQGRKEEGGRTEMKNPYFSFVIAHNYFFWFWLAECCVKICTFKNFCFSLHNAMAGLHCRRRLTRITRKGMRVDFTGKRTFTDVIFYIRISQIHCARRYATERPRWVYDTLSAVAVATVFQAVISHGVGYSCCLSLHKAMREPGCGIGGQ